MKRASKRVALIVAAALIGVGANATMARAQVLGDVLKSGAIIFGVRQFGGQINSFLNSLLNQRGIAYRGATKVVPIISAGRGIHIGAAQVVGPPEQVERVRGVGQVESRLGDLQGNLLLPTTSLTPGRDIDRVRGVGVGALIDFEI